MFSRALATVLVITLGTWLATPAFARLRCRSASMHCAHCMHAVSSPVPAVKSDCCVVTPAVAHPNLDLPQAASLTALALAVDQRLPASPHRTPAAERSHAPSAGPPFDFRNPPLLC